MTNMSELGFQASPDLPAPIRWVHSLPLWGRELVMAGTVVTVLIVLGAFLTLRRKR